MFPVYPDTAHKIVDARCDRNRFLRRIQSKKGLTGVNNAAEPVFINIRIQPAYIQPYLISLSHQLPFFPWNHIPRHQIAKFRIFFFHKVIRFSVSFYKEPSAFTSGRFCDQHLFAVQSDRSRMILDKFAVGKRNTICKKTGCHITGISDRACCIAE